VFNNALRVDLDAYLEPYVGPDADGATARQHLPR
jgi:hypothetical protein